MPPRFLADADLNHKTLLGLRWREPTIDFLSAREGGVIGLPDPDVLNVAADLGRLLVTHDRTTMSKHFINFIRNRASPGVLILSQDLDIGLAIDDLLLIWLSIQADEWTAQLVFLPI